MVEDYDDGIAFIPCTLVDHQLFIPNEYNSRELYILTGEDVEDNDAAQLKDNGTVQIKCQFRSSKHTPSNLPHSSDPFRFVSFALQNVHGSSAGQAPQTMAAVAPSSLVQFQF